MRIALLALIALAIPSLTRAQPVDDPVVTLFGGYSYLRADTMNADAVSEHGGTAQVRVANGPTDTFGIGLDFSSHSTSYDVGVTNPLKSRRLVFTAGPQWLVAKGKTQAVVHAFGGFAHTRGTVTFPEGGVFTEEHFSVAVVLGGAIDHRIRQRIAIRFLQADYLLTHFAGEVQNNVRLSGGIVLNLGGL